MPTYEYHCEKCNRNFETFQSMKDPAFVTCPRELCQQETWGCGKVRRLLGTGAGLIFKGSGFYITDYRSKGYQEAAKKDSASTTGGGDKGGSGGSSAGDSKKTAGSGGGGKTSESTGGGNASAKPGKKE